MSDENLNTSESTVEKSEKQSVHWMDSLPEDIKNDSTLSNFKDKDVTEVVKSYVSAQRMLGSSIRIPGPDASAEAKSEFFKKVESVPGVTRLPDPNDPEATKSFFAKIGRPENPTGYKFNLPEGAKVNEEVLNKFKEKAHTMGLNNVQAEELIKYDIEMKQESLKRMEQGRANASTVLQKEWGTEYENKLGSAKNLLGHFESKFPDAVNEIKNSSAGNNPIILIALSELSKHYREGGIIKGDSVAGGHTPEEAKARIQEIRNNKDHPFNSKKQDKAHYNAVEEMNKLYSSAHPES